LFHSNVKIIEYNILDVQNQLLSLKEPDVTIQKSLKSKINKYVKEAKEIEKNYLSALKIANNERLTFIEQNKNILGILQGLEEELIKFTKDFLMKYVIYNNQLCKNLQFDNNTRMNVSIIIL